MFIPRLSGSLGQVLDGLATGHVVTRHHRLSSADLGPDFLSLLLHRIVEYGGGGVSDELLQGPRPDRLPKYALRDYVPPVVALG